MNTMKSNESANEIEKRFLIVDDDRSISRVLSTVLQKFGKTTTVDSGNQAIELLKTQEFDLILTDYEMDQGNGLDLLEYLARHNNKTLTIMVTAFGTKELIAKTIKYHIFGFIEKPFNQGIIENLVKEAMTAKEQEEKVASLAILGSTAGELVHEVSNPLTTLEFQLEQLKGREGQAQVDGMNKTVERMKKIFSASVAMIHQGKDPNPSQFNLDDAIREAKEDYAVKAKMSKVNIEISGDFDFLVLGNKERVRQAILNLVNNAIDAAAEAEQKWVKVTNKRDEKGIHIQITDSGDGISDETRTKIFQPLFTTKGTKGTGIGLSLVKKVAREHSGNIYINTDCEHTQFVLFLPIAKIK